MISVLKYFVTYDFTTCVEHFKTILDSPDPPSRRFATARLFYAFGATHDEAKQNKDVFYIFSNGLQMIWSNRDMYIFLHIPD